MGKIAHDFKKMEGNIPMIKERGRVVKVTRRKVFGNFDPQKISTSHIERGNLTIRLTNGRLTRKTLGFSKDLKEHKFSMMLFIISSRLINLFELR